MAFELAMQFFEEKTALKTDDWIPRYISPDELLEIIWPLNDVFRPGFSTTKQIPYNASFEVDADVAIERFTFGDGENEWRDLSPMVWRILFERHKQLLITAGLNIEANEEIITVVPAQLDDTWLLRAVMLLLLHQMELPFPPEDQADDGWPEGLIYPSAAPQ